MKKLEDFGYTLEQSITGYWRLIKDGNLFYDDPTCEDLNGTEEQARYFFDDYLMTYCYCNYE